MATQMQHLWKKNIKKSTPQKPFLGGGGGALGAMAILTFQFHWLPLQPKY